MRTTNIERREDDLIIETKRGELSDDGIRPKRFSTFLSALLAAEKTLPHKDFKVIPEMAEMDIKI
jgi:hypothetical protein